MDQRTAPKLFYVILFIFLGLFSWLCWAFISAIVLGLVIASAFYPLYSWFRGLFKGREVFKALAMTIFVFLVLTIPISGFVGSLYTEALGLYSRTRDSVSIQKMQEILESDSIWVKRLHKVSEYANIKLDPQSIQETAASMGKDLGLFLTRQLSSFATNIMGFMLDFMLMLLIIYYLFKDGERLNNYLLSLLPFPRSQQELILAKFHEMGRAIIFGNGLSGIIQGILGGFAFYFFGLGSPFLWGTIMGFLAFLPVIGASVVFIPATLILLIQGEIGAGIGYLIYNAAYSIVIEYFIKPRLIGKGMKMNTIFVFIGILGGLKLWGILGIIYGPFIITIIFTLFEIYRLEYRTMKV
ncbi:MAG: AI-2E family transporter [Desulfatiglans sp.]|nr:AI-2E family transporter [Desulfatiglans sp.]